MSWCIICYIQEGVLTLRYLPAEQSHSQNLAVTMTLVRALAWGVAIRVLEAAGFSDNEWGFEVVALSADA